MHRLEGIGRRFVRRLAILGAIAVSSALPLPATAACRLERDAAAPLEAQIDVLVAAIDDCDEAHALDDEAAIKAKALLIKLRADVAEVRRRHRGDLLEGDRERFSTRLSRILAQVPKG